MEKEIVRSEKYVDPQVPWLVKERGFPDKIHVSNKLDRSSRDVCEDYLRSQDDFQIYKENRLIFDSSTTDRANIVFYDKYFTLYLKYIPYNGIKITNKLPI